MRQLCLCVLVVICGGELASAATSDLADAVMKRDGSALRALLQKKADVNAPQNDGTTALLWAVRYDDLDTADRLIRAGANVSAGNRDGATPLQLATCPVNHPCRYVCANIRLRSWPKKLLNIRSKLRAAQRPR